MAVHFSKGQAPNATLLLSALTKIILISLSIALVSMGASMNARNEDFVVFANSENTSTGTILMCIGGAGVILTGFLLMSLISFETFLLFVSCLLAFLAGSAIICLMVLGNALSDELYATLSTAIDVPLAELKNHNSLQGELTAGARKMKNIQIEFKCCGKNGFKDYASPEELGMFCCVTPESGDRSDLQPTCAANSLTSVGLGEGIYTEGCLGKLEEFVEDHKAQTFIYCLILAASFIGSSLFDGLIAARYY